MILWDPHHLISMKIEEEKNGDEKKVVVCSLCEEPVSSLLMLGNNNLNNNGPSSFYKCSFPNCTFLIHQPCAQLPFEIPTHPLHFSDHKLRLYYHHNLKIFAVLVVKISVNASITIVETVSMCST
jgi:hypothetical protein